MNADGVRLRGERLLVVSEPAGREALTQANIVLPDAATKTDPIWRRVLKVGHLVEDIKEGDIVLTPPNIMHLPYNGKMRGMITIRDVMMVKDGESIG